MKALLISLIALTTPVFAQDAAAPDPAEESLQKFPETAPPHAVLLHPHREQRNQYIWETFGAPGIVNAAIGAGIGQALNTPDVWGQSERAFVKRFATEYAESGINSTTKYVLARLRDEDPAFHSCTCSGFRRRALHAILSPVIAYRFSDGEPQFSAARMAGTAAAGFISASTWKPGPPGAGDQLAHIGVDLLSAMGENLLREFVFHRRRLPGAAGEQ
jgi:hypothetical protein